ncbi:MAG: helix-turn-helix transcriptional regulator [Planctomycetota bacterium]|nr:helix-turn-helix transcriptional regulator [Planctomycetota bacterium]
MFLPGQTVKYGPVASVMQLWCSCGSGVVEVNATRFAVHPGMVVLMPWRHHVRYTADRAQAWHLSGLHVFPVCAPPPNIPLPLWEVPHDQHHPLADAPWLNDDPRQPIRTPFARELEPSHPLLELTRYVIRRFREPAISPATMRHAAELVLGEWRQLVMPSPPLPMPQPLRRITDRADDPASALLDLDQWAAIAGVSRATLARLARGHWQRGLMAYLRHRRLVRAADLLRSTRDPIGSIASCVGFTDPQHFSRAFRGEYGISPQDYRSQYGGL